MKRLIACALTALTLSLLYVGSVYSECPPTWSVTGDDIQGCPSPSREKTWRIYW